MSLNKNTFTVIAIDGGAASGKSTTARALAEKLHLLHVDTGEHYRALSRELMNEGIEAQATEALKAALSNLTLSTTTEKNTAHITLNGQVLSQDAIRSDEVTYEVSAYAAVPEIREALKNYQRAQVELAREKGFAGVVMEGRDVTSVILPQADWKFFLEADVETRTQRRAAEGKSDEIARRDKLDSSRKTAPMVCPSDAIRINTSHTSREDVVEIIGTKIQPNWKELDV